MLARPRLGRDVHFNRAVMEVGTFDDGGAFALIGEMDRTRLAFVGGDLDFGRAAIDPGGA